jgi:putative zinc finger/helix-turn-helix YgiT family protein
MEVSKMSRCVMCGGGPVIYKTGNWKDTSIGLPNITLIGITLGKCKQCGERYVGIPRALELHNLIASRVASKRGRLTGKEIRFLRSHLGWSSGVEFAQHFGVSPETVSRWENGKEPIGPVADRLLRMATRFKKPLERCAVEDVLDAIRKKNASNGKSIRLKQVRREWKLLA